MDDAYGVNFVVPDPITGTDQPVDFAMVEVRPSPAEALAGKTPEIRDRIIVNPRKAPELTPAQIAQKAAETKLNLERTRAELRVHQTNSVDQETANGLQNKWEDIKFFANSGKAIDLVKKIGVGNLAGTITSAACIVVPRILESKGINIDGTLEAFTNVAPGALMGGGIGEQTKPVTKLWKAMRHGELSKLESTVARFGDIALTALGVTAGTEVVMDYARARGLPTDPIPFVDDGVIGGASLASTVKNRGRL